MKNFKYVGNCVNSFNDDGECLLSIFSDTSDFANVEENSEIVSKSKFINNVTLNKFFINLVQKNSTKILYNKDRDIYMIYDENKDIHYFFESSLQSENSLSLMKILKEIFDYNNFNYKIQSESDSYFESSFTVNDKSYDFFIKLDKNNFHEIYFNYFHHKRDDNEGSIDYNIMNNSNTSSIKVFSAVLFFIKYYIKKYNPEKILFSSKEESRTKLYKKIVDVVSKKFGYKRKNILFKPNLFALIKTKT